MNKDRLIQIIAAGLIVVSLGVSIALIQPINDRRLDLQLGFNAEVGDRVPPKYVLLAASLGSFRGVAANILWYRIEMMKREGKFFEINQLSRWITALQPRFPRVWAFMAWNMAYNISVETDTPRERWHWVNQGIRILREEGIVHNPRAVPLYRELGWIFFHKVGGSTDDMHWYYKEQLAREWSEILGAPKQGETTQQVIADFDPVADAAERYFVFNRPTREMYRLLEDIANQESDSKVIREKINDLKHANLNRLERSLDALQAELQSVLGPKVSRERVEPLRQAIEQRKDQVAVDPLALLYQDAPATRPLLADLRAQEIELNRLGLRRIGGMKVLLDYVGEPMVRSRADDVFTADQRVVFDLLTNPEHAEAWQALMPYWRAKVLLEDYRMDPGYMAILMERYGPLDWRHPAAQSVYWNALGIEVSLNVLDRSKLDILNTERQVIHGMQQMMYSGRLNHDPTTGRMTTLPDPRFIPAYEKAMLDAVDRYEGGELGTSGTLKTFESGHENFLVKAVVYSWLYGDVEQAQDYYDKLRDQYRDKPHAQREGLYTYTLDDFVKRHITDEVYEESVNTYQFIDAMVRRAFIEGLGNHRRDVFDQYLAVAQYVQQQYQKLRGRPNPNAADGRERMIWGSFDELVNASFVELMRSPVLPLVERSRIYNNTPPQIRLKTYIQIRQTLVNQLDGSGIRVETMFPPPPGFEETIDIDKKLEGVDDRGPTGVESK